MPIWDHFHRHRDFAPASPAESHKRMLVVLSFWVAVLVGLVLWHSTTTIYRAQLPLVAMSEWSDRMRTETRFSIPIGYACDIDLRKAIEVASDALSTDTDRKFHHIRLQECNDSCALQLVEGTKYSASLHPWKRQLTITYPARDDDLYSRLGHYISATLSSLLTSERQVIRYALFHQETDKVPAFARRVVKSASCYHIAFSLLNGGAGLGALDDWDIEAYFHPLQKRLHDICDITIESQIQYYAGLSFTPSPSTSEGFEVHADQLSGFVNAAEWDMTTATISCPNLNFILYVPAVEQRPLHILDERGQPVRSNAFLLPQWGSVVVLNPETNLLSTDKAALKGPISIFAAHLLSLLGLPMLPSALLSDYALPLSEWQVDGLVRQRIAENIRSAADTIGSLSRLIRKIENMAVPAQIRIDIEYTLSELNKAHAALQTEDFQLALQHSQLAVDSAERAFYAPTMVSRLYFPDEHKYAIYTPLFGPLALPLVMALVREINTAIRQWRRKLTSSFDNLKPKVV